MEDCFNAADVFQILGISYLERKNVQVICPVCGHKKFYMNMNKSVGCCKRASCGFHGNQISYYAKSRGISNKDAYKEILDFLGKGIVVKQKTFVDNDATQASLKRRNKAYNCLKDQLSLSPFHVEKLMKRGLKKEEIETLNYRSYFYKDVKENGEKYAREISKEGIDLKGVPGFFKNESGTFSLKYGKSGILVPYLSSKGEIQGFQIRRDNPRIENGKTKDKYIWLATTGFQEGASASSWVHYACNRAYDLYRKELVPILGKKIYLTEGAMKADIAHKLTGNPFIALPGVECLIELKKQLPYLKAMGVETICVAYDMDYLTNPNVAAAQEKLKIMLTDYGFNVTRKTWETLDGKLKGIDDFYAYHLRNIK